MEGFNWIRVGGVVALLLGSLYALMPTMLQEDLETRLARRTESVEAPSVGPAVDYDAEFDVSGDAAAAAKVLETRLKAAGVPTNRVEVDGGRLKVVVNPGGRLDDVARLAGREGAVALHPASVLPEAPASASEVPEHVAVMVEGAGLEPATWGPRVVAAAGKPAGSERIEGMLSGLEVSDEGVITATLNGGFPEDSPLLVASIDGALQASVIAEADKVIVVPLPGVTDPDLAAILASGGLGAALTRVAEAPVAAVPEQGDAPVDEAPVVASAIPDWVLGMLPNTKINLGLDLQGGVDLTLQVGLDEAVESNVSRDAVRLKEQAKRAGIELVGVRADRTQPLLWVESALELSEVRDFVQSNLGIDYVYHTSEGSKHGFEMSEQRQNEVKEQAVEQVLETLRKRVDATGVKEPSIVRKGGGRINVQLPGEVDLQAAIDAIGTTAVLEFRMVDEDFDDSVLDKILQAAKDALPADQYADDKTVNAWLWDTKRLEEDRIVMWRSEELDGEQDKRAYPMVLKNEVVLTGNDVNNAGVGWDQNQQAYVSLDFKPRGGRIFCEITSANVGKRFGIILDGELKSAPNIREAICGGSARIDMGGSADPLNDAQNLSLVLRTGSLDAPVDLGGVSTIGASLGADSIKQGSEAAVIGGFIVLIFMALWYRTAGILADFALGLNVLLVLACLATFGATLTLPGIAGIALTVGMAVDANIIIFERIREERKLGVHPRKAVDVGFDKGLVAVLDANVTTAIAGIVLYSYGTGPIKGFAVTLLIGILTTLVTALFVTRTFMDLSTRSSSARLRI